MSRDDNTKSIPITATGGSTHGSEAVDLFLRRVACLNKSDKQQRETKNEDAARIIVASNSSCHDATDVKSLLFLPDPSASNANSEKDGQYIIVIVPTSERVDLHNLSQAIDSSSSAPKWELAPSYLVKDICGFRPGTVPPFGHTPSPQRIIVDRGLVEGRKGLDSRILGGSGTEEFRCLIRVGSLLDMGAAEVADVVMSEEVNGDRKRIDVFDRPKPFFPVAPPPTDNAGAPYENKSQSYQTHDPVFVTAIGRITSVRRMAKRLVFADLAPPDHRYKIREENAPTTDPTEKDMPWRSGADGLDMAVQLIVGKTLCDRLGEVEGPAALKTLKPGRLVFIRGRANIDPDPRHGWKSSVGNWVEKRNLDVVVSSFEILDDFIGVEEEAKAGRQRHRKSYSLSDQSQLPGRASAAPVLTLDDFDAPSQQAPFLVSMVDTPKSVETLSNALSIVLNSAGSSANNETALFTAGIDCEWRPTGLYSSSPDAQPVSLLQISLPSLGRVFLVDTHVLLRPNLHPSSDMEPSERALSVSLASIFLSKSIIKVGFHVAADLRRLAASFPHLPAFRSIHAVVELSTLARRVYPKTSRHSTGSLARLTKLMLDSSLSKEQQCSDWALRPLTPAQVEYAALDCAIPTHLLEKMGEDTGVINLKSILPQLTSSWRFLIFDSGSKDAIRRLKAKRVVGDTFVVTQSWITERPAPAIPSVPREGEDGPYTDKSGVLQVPSHLVKIRGEIDGAIAASTNLLGKEVGKSKGKCIDLLAMNSMLHGAKLEYNPRSGFVEFQDGVVLFVNMPDRNGRGRRTPYPNEWLESGKILTWYLREKDWESGTSVIARKLGFGGFSNVDQNGDGATLPTEVDVASPTIILFVRMGDGAFLCCGKCAVSLLDQAIMNVLGSKRDRGGRNLVKLHLELVDWEKLKASSAFHALVNGGARKIDSATYAISNDELEGTSISTVVDSTDYQEKLAKMVIDGDVIGALGRALDGANTSPKKRSVAAGVGCLKNVLARSNDPSVLRAVEILDNVAESLGLF